MKRTTLILFFILTVVLSINAETVLLIGPVEDTDATTAIKDYSTRGHVPAIIGVSENSSETSVFGVTSHSVPVGGQNGIVVPDSDDFHFVGDFTIDIWAFFHSADTYDTCALGRDYKMLWQQASDSANFFSLTFRPQCPGDLQVGITAELRRDGVTLFSAYEGDHSAPPTDQWVHYRVKRELNTVSVMENGVVISSVMYTGTFDNLTGAFVFGTSLVSVANFNGFIDEPHIVNGVALAGGAPGQSAIIIEEPPVEPPTQCNTNPFDLDEDGTLDGDLDNDGDIDNDDKKLAAKIRNKRKKEIDDQWKQWHNMFKKL